MYRHVYLTNELPIYEPLASPVAISFSLNVLITPRKFFQMTGRICSVSELRDIPGNPTERRESSPLLPKKLEIRIYLYATPQTTLDYLVQHHPHSHRHRCYCSTSQTF